MAGVWAERFPESACRGCVCLTIVGLNITPGNRNEVNVWPRQAQPSGDRYTRLSAAWREAGRCGGGDGSKNANFHLYVGKKVKNK